MIQIANVAQLAQKFLIEKGFECFKIFVRLNFSIDVYVFVSGSLSGDELKEEFLHLVPNRSLLMKTEDNFKLKFHVLSVADKEDPFYSNLFANGENNIDWGPRYRFDSLLKKESVTPNHSTLPVVSFYSYKGGMGRSTTMIAYALDLVLNRNKKVVIVDCDLEAPGYLNFFNLANYDKLNRGEKNGLVEFLSDSQFVRDAKTIDIKNYIINVGDCSSKESYSSSALNNLLIVPAGNLNEGLRDSVDSSHRLDYLEGLAKINLSNVQSVIQGFSLLFEKLNEEYQPDCILIDSRTGFNDVFGTAAFYLSTAVVGFFGFSRQTQPGLSNVISDYYKSDNDFKLHLVFSILPQSVEGKEVTWVEESQKQVYEFIDDLSNDKKDYPSFTYLHRNAILEKIGVEADCSDSLFLEMITKQTNPDYMQLFSQINSIIGVVQKEDTFLKKSDIVLRNDILHHLQSELEKIKPYAEQTQITTNQFFYRECMKEFFLPEKFLIRGYKGTGKTYLYKALAQKDTSVKIQEWANRNKQQIKETMFVQILPEKDGGGSFPFEDIKYESISDHERFFRRFWQVYTWNVLLLRDEFEDVRNSSKLSSMVLPVDRAEALKRFKEIIDNDDCSQIIEEDFERINSLLEKNNKELFILYDRLDTCINPLRWSKAVSPLIGFWRQNFAKYSQMRPKIFIRTDLFRVILGTNTEQLDAHFINIEWTIGEVFGFVFKLIFSNEETFKSFWEISKRLGAEPNWMKNTQTSLVKNSYQFKSLEFAHLKQAIDILFGKQVVVYTGANKAYLGTPWEYFQKELATADNGAITLRPFIITLDDNAISLALKQTVKSIRAIIDPNIYAATAVRENTTNRYFDDLTKDPYSIDLRTLRDVVREFGGDIYRYKALNAEIFAKLKEETLSRLSESDVVKTSQDLENLIFANGIMAKKVTNHGYWYRFAPIYWYTWGLANSELEVEERRNGQARNNDSKNEPEQKIIEKTEESSPSAKRLYFGDYDKKTNWVWFKNSSRHYTVLTMKEELYDGAEVNFELQQDENRPNFYYAVNVEIIG